MDKEFAHRVLLLTGATSGIGKATALRFAQAGANVVAVGRDSDSLRQLQATIGEAKCLTIAADVSAEREIDGVVIKALEKFGGIDVLVNAAGHISSGTIE